MTVLFIRENVDNYGRPLRLIAVCCTQQAEPVISAATQKNLLTLNKWSAGQMYANISIISPHYAAGNEVESCNVIECAYHFRTTTGTIRQWLPVEGRFV